MATAVPTMPIKTQLAKAGFEGAGNFTRVTESNASTSNSQSTIKQNTPINFTVGVGVAENFRSSSDIPIVSSVDACIREPLLYQSSPDICHYGISSAKNITRRESSPRSESSSSTRSSPSSSSSSSVKQGLGKIKARIQSHINARNSRASHFEAWPRKLPAHPSRREHRVSNFSSSASYNSDATLSSRVGDLKDRFVWRIDRITAYGLDDGMESSKPAYVKLEA